MITLFTVVLVGSICLCVGFFSRELRDRLKRVESALRVLLVRQAKEEQKEKKMGYAEPMSMVEYNELEDEAKINALNK